MSEQKQHDISVLYVEDEADTREEIVNLLQRRVAQVLVAVNGAEGLEQFRQHTPDLVITDIRMPVLDGLAMAEKIKEIDRECQIIVTTAHSDVSFMMRAIEIGVDQYVLKPIETARLFVAIGKCAEIIALRKAERIHREEKEKMIAELRNALAGVKLLSGFLPICASCKKIRDTRGNWQQIEAYISSNSEAKFSHGICPECTQILYPEYYERTKDKQEEK
jgi:YesN/AraC family two-component response regulator